jgi:chemotaxis protein methyltransferase CheR
MPLTITDVDFVRDLVAKQSGNILRTGQSDLIESRLSPIAKDAGLANVEQLIAELKRAKSPRLSPGCAGGYSQRNQLLS